MCYSITPPAPVNRKNWKTDEKNETLLGRLRKGNLSFSLSTFSMKFHLLNSFLDNIMKMNCSKQFVWVAFRTCLVELSRVFLQVVSGIFRVAPCTRDVYWSLYMVTIETKFKHESWVKQNCKNKWKFLW